MADALYNEILRRLQEAPESGGVDPAQFGYPKTGDAAYTLPDFPPIPAPTAPAQDLLPSPRPRVGLLQRPQQAVSELLQGGHPLDALISGRASKPSLGYALFPEAEQRGFQPGDVPAFLIDAATDPLTYILPKFLSGAFKAAGKLFGSPESVAFLSKTAEDILGRTGLEAQQKALTKMWKPPDMGGVGMTDEWFKELLVDSGLMKAGAEVPNIKDLDQTAINLLLSHMQNTQYRVYQPHSGMLGQIANRMGLWLQPIVGVLERQGGAWGPRLAGGIKSMMRGTYENYGRVVNDYLSAVERLGLTGTDVKAHREAAYLLAEAGLDPFEVARVAERHGAVSPLTLSLAQSDDKTINELAKIHRNIFDRYQDILAGFKDAHNRTFMIQTEEGLIPFHEGTIANYMPHMWNWDELKTGKKGWDAFVSNFAKQQKVPLATAENMLETFIKKSPRKFGAIEHTRLKDLGGYMLDPLEVLPNYVFRSEYRLNFAKNFGIDGRSVEQLMKGAVSSGLDAQWAKDVEAILFDRHPRQYEVRQLINKITGFQVVNKMSLGSTIANLSQNVNTIASFGLRNWMQGIMNTGSEEGARYGALAYNRATKEAIEEMITGAPASGWAGKFLDALGFNWAEKWNRFYAANTGVAALRNWTTELRGLEPGTKAFQRVANRLMRTMNLTEEEVLQLARTGQPTREILDRSALLASENTQHATQWHQLPKLWQIPEAKIALQYKNFAYNQTRYMFQQIITPALEYVGTNGASGDLIPLLRAVPLFTTAGAAVNHLRDLTRIPLRGIMKGDWSSHEKYLWDNDKDWMMEALKDSLSVGAFGVMGDMFTAIERGKFPEWMLGPTVGDISQMGERAFHLAEKVKNREDLGHDLNTFGTWLGRRVIPPALTKVPMVGYPLAVIAQQYPYDLTYGDIDLDRFPRQLRSLLERYRQEVGNGSQ